MLFHCIVALVAGLCLSGSLAQDDLASNIPTEEADALENVVEDEPNEFNLLKDWESPEYNLIFRVPLPIPQVKEPDMCVNAPCLPTLINHS